MEKTEENNLCATHVIENNVNIENTNPNQVIILDEEMVLSSNVSKASETTQAVNRSSKQNKNNKLIYRNTKPLNKLVALRQYRQTQKEKETARKQPWNYPLLRIGKRKLLVDKHTVISALQIKEQLLFTENIVSLNEYAPFTKNGMKRLRDGIPRMFAYPTHRNMSGKLVDLYSRNCTTVKQPDVEILTDIKLEPITQTKKIKLDNRNKVETVRYNNKKLDKQEVIVIPEDGEILTLKEKEIVIPEDGDILNAKTNEEHLKVEEIVIPENGEILTLTEEEIVITEDGEILTAETEDIKLEETVNLENGEILTFKQEDEHIKVEEIANEETVVTPEDGEILMLKTEDKEHMIIIQKVGNEISYSRKNLEQLMDTAVRNQIVTFCNSDDNSLIIVQNEDVLITT